MIEGILEKAGSGAGFDRRELRYLLENREQLEKRVFQKAEAISRKHFHGKIYVRGLIEFTNYCKNNCFYCGIRRDNAGLERFRLDVGAMEDAVRAGAAMGFRTFVLQGGEDPYFTDEILADRIARIKAICPDAAVTLSVGERSLESYARLKRAGADRFLLRHETGDGSGEEKAMPVGSQGIRIPSGERIYGGKPLSEDRESDRGLYVLTRTRARHGGDRSLCPPPRHAV